MALQNVGLPTIIFILDNFHTFPILRLLHARAIKAGLSHHDLLRAKLSAAYANFSEIGAAHTIFSLCNRQSTYLYNTLIRGYSSVGEFRLSISLFARMHAARKPPDPNTFPAVLKSVSAISALGLGRLVHCAVVVNGFESDIANCNALVTMYAKCGDLGSARKVFDGMSVRNGITWSSMMGAYGMHGRFAMVCGLFEGMLAEEWIRPDGQAFTTVLSACSHGGLLEKGKEYFEMMRMRFGRRPDMKHYTCLVDMFGRAGMIKEAKDVVENMEMEPDEALWRAVFQAFRRHGCMDTKVRGRNLMEMVL